MTAEITIKPLVEQPTFSTRLTCPTAQLGETLGQLLPELWHTLERAGIQPAGPPFVRSHAYSPEEMDIEAGVSVTQPVAAIGRGVASSLPGGRAAVLWHVGPYDTLNQSYMTLEAWITTQGHTRAGAPWEVYWTDPHADPDPATWRTEIIWPIA